MASEKKSRRSCGGADGVAGLTGLGAGMKAGRGWRRLLDRSRGGRFGGRVRMGGIGRRRRWRG